MLASNGIGCAALGLAALLTAAVVSCGGADNCVAVKCTSGALLHIKLAQSPASLVGTTVKVCRNAECYTAALPELPAADVASAGLSFTGATFVVGTLWQEADQSAGLDVEWHSDVVQDGDRYVVSFTNAAGVETPMLDKTATYSLLPPSSCGPATCRVAELTP